MTATDHGRVLVGSEITRVTNLSLNDLRGLTRNELDEIRRMLVRIHPDYNPKAVQYWKEENTRRVRMAMRRMHLVLH